MLLPQDFKEIKRLIDNAVEEISKLIYVREIYLFGSVLNERVTGGSDIDLIVVVDEIDAKDAYLDINIYLEDVLGEGAYLFDIHVVDVGVKDKIPYKWFIRKAKKVFSRQ